MTSSLSLTFLGTGDASGYPHPFCNCENCVEAREVGGKSFRLRSHALINDELLIDCGPDLLSSAFIQRKSLHDIKYVVQTHPHMDHLEPAQLAMRNHRFGIHGLEHLEFYGTGASVAKVRTELVEAKAVRTFPEAEILDYLKLSLHEIAAHQTFNVGPYEFTAVPASHDSPGMCVLYAIRLGDHAIFYGTDSGPIADEAWETLKAKGITFDVVILDHTMGVNEGNAGHMSGAMVVDTIARMRDYGLLREGVRAYGTHVAPHSNPIHEKMSIIAAESGYEIAYDGLTITLG
jgi:phosphoribosyl 1,2-cyclic phosphodiesterase